MSRIGHIGLIGLSIFLLQPMRADSSAELAEASAPLAEGVPEVAVARLRALLSKNLPDPEWLVDFCLATLAGVLLQPPAHPPQAARSLRQAPPSCQRALVAKGKSTVR